MIKKPGFFYDQSGVIPFRFNDGRLEILLITTRKRKRWVIPKGVIESGQTPAISAQKEALEEAGVIGKVSDKPVGSYIYRKWGGNCKVEIFLLEVKNIIDIYPESNIRVRQWFEYDEAVENVGDDNLKVLLKDVKTMFK